LIGEVLKEWEMIKTHISYLYGRADGPSALPNKTAC